MGCILACLRFKDESKKKRKAHLKSSPVPSKTKEHLLPKEHFVSVFTSEGSACEQVVDLNSLDNIDECILDRDFRDEVKFLKSCGAILETPAEIRKAAVKLVAQHHNKDIALSSSSVCLPAASFKKLVWDEHHEISDFAQNSSAGFGECQARRHNDSASPSATVAEEHVYLESGTEFAALDVSSSQDDTQIPPDGSEDYAFRLNPAIELTSESTVLDVSPFQDDTHINNLGSEGVSGGNTKHDPGVEPRKVSVVLDVSPTQDDTQIQGLASKHSPYPTPLKLTDEMETPGTIYPFSYENLRRKNARVRTQYVYPVLNPVGNLSQWTELREGSKQLSQPHWAERTPLASSANQKDKRSPNREEFDKEKYGSSVKRMRSLSPISDSRWKVTASIESHQLLVAGLSQCLKPPPGNERSRAESNAMNNSRPEWTPNMDRPIFGVVAMHWNEDEDDPSNVTPKWWGGNGIPNTTTKYKEDQKVSWHATPFEERLDKALSDDKLVPRRKEISRKLVGLKDEGGESDTGSS